MLNIVSSALWGESPGVMLGHIRSTVLGGVVVASSLLHVWFVLVLHMFAWKVHVLSIVK